MPSNSRANSYDGLSRLVSASGPWGSGSYTYDALGNLRQKQLGSRTVGLNYNSVNRLVTSDDSGASGLRSFSYDSRGNVIAAGALQFSYDAENQPISVSGSSSGNYVYDGNLKRVKQTVNGATIYNVYDKAGQLVHVDKRDAGKSTDYIHGAQGTLARITNNAVTYLHHDSLGSAQSGTDSSGAILWQEAYTPYGEALNDVSANQDLAGFTGHIKDDATGLSYMQARYYDPVIGRFYSNDPVGWTPKNPVMSFNRYLYVNNNPYKYTDPNGEFLNFAVKFVADVALGAALNYAETGSVNIGGAVADAALGALNPAKTVQKAQRLAKVIKGGCSFTPETMILTKDGYKTIIEVNVGDIVLSKNDETGEVSWREVTDTFKDWHTETITFTVVDENGTEESITTTAEHPFYIDNQGWLPAGNVSEGTVISGPKADNNISIVSIQVNNEPQYAYNFTVDTDHTYFVGKTNMWVHNACNFSKVPKSPTGKGSVAPGDRDPKRTYSRGETNEMLQDQGGKCAGCGETKSLSEVDGHHVQRHADGGPTTKENGAALCKDCHKEVHAKEKLD